MQTTKASTTDNNDNKTLTTTTRTTQEGRQGNDDVNNVPPRTPVRNSTISTTRRREGDDNQSSPTSPSKKRNKFEEGPTSNALFENLLLLTNNQFESPLEFINVFAEYLERYTSKDEWVPPSSSEKSAFFGISVPDMGPKDYVARIFVYAYCSPSAFIVALILLKRAANKHMELCWTVSNIHRLLLASVIVATKIVDDRLFTMAHYSRVGGVPTTKETLRLELIFLRSINNEIGISEKSFFEMMNELVSIRDELRKIEKYPNQVSSKDVMTTSHSVSGAATTTTTTAGDISMSSDDVSQMPPTTDEIMTSTKDSNRPWKRNHQASISDAAANFRMGKKETHDDVP